AGETMVCGQKKMRALLCLGLTFFISLALKADGGGPEQILTQEELNAVEGLSSQPLKEQAENIGKSVKIVLLKSHHKGALHNFDFLEESQLSVDDIPDLEGLYGKVACPKEGSGSMTLYLADDAPPTMLLHQFIHYLQINQEKRWCALEGRVLEQPEKGER